LDRSEGLCILNRTPLEEINETVRTSGSLSDQSTSHRYLSHPDSHQRSGSKNMTTPPRVDYMEKLRFNVVASFKYWFCFVMSCLLFRNFRLLAFESTIFVVSVCNIYIHTRTFCLSVCCLKT
jgi:hypothetical protein